MNRMVLLAGLAALAGCGPAFEGTWGGTLTINGNCGVGTMQVPTTWTIDRTSGGQLEIVAGGSCDPYRATQSGATATMLPKTCAANLAVTSGTLTLTEPSLAVVIQVVGTGPNAGCSSGTTGSLTRQ